MSTAPDIFLSYHRDDQPTAGRFAESFKSAGFGVWWKVRLMSGDAVDQVTEKALKTAKAVVVLWSKKSVDRSGRTEATLADRNRALAAKNHGDQWLPLEFAEALYPLPLTDDGHRRALLREAAKLVDHLTSSIEALHDTREWRARIQTAQHGSDVRTLAQ